MSMRASILGWLNGSALLGSVRSRASRHRLCWVEAGVWVLSGHAPPPLANEGWPDHMASLHGWADGNAVHRVRIEGNDGAARAHGPGLPALPLPQVWQAVQ